MDLNISGRTQSCAPPRKAWTRLRGSAGGRGRQRCDQWPGCQSPCRNDDTNSESRARTVTAVAADITTQEGQAKLLEACPDPDILVNNNAGPNPGDFFGFDQEAWHRALDANMIAP